MASTLEKLTGEGLTRFIQTGTEGIMAKHEAVLQLKEGHLLLDEFKRRGGILQKKWTKAHWNKLNKVVDQFCKTTQQMNMSIGGLKVQIFDDASELVGSFIVYAEELLSEAKQVKRLPDESTLNNILGVIERCQYRVNDFDLKRRDITIYRRNIEEITDP